MSQAANKIEDIVAHLEELVELGKIDEAASLFSSLDAPMATDVLLRLTDETRRRLFASSRLDNVAEVLAKLPDEMILEIFFVKGVDDLSRILSSRPVDEIADILFKLPRKARSDILAVLPPHVIAELAKVIKFPPESIGGIMTTQVPVFEADMRVGEVLELYILRLRQGLYDKHHYIYVVDRERRLIGYVDPKILLTKPREATIGSCSEPVRAYADPFSDREEAARLSVAYDLVEVPVVDFDGRFLGIVSLDDVLDVVVSEYTEDLLKYGGFIEALRGSYITASPLRLALRRAPMLIYLYLFNVVTGGVVAAFEDVITRVAVLAAFMPLLADNSGNIGSQASTLILRSLVTGELKPSKRDILRVLLKEIMTTSVLLTILAPVAFAIGFSIPYLALGGNISLAAKVAIVVTVALTVSCYIADVVGSMLPVILVKLRLDPAAASAPLVTTIADVSTVLTYFTIASMILAL